MEEIVTERLRLGALRAKDRAALLALLTDEEVGQTYMIAPLTG